MFILNVAKLSNNEIHIFKSKPQASHCPFPKGFFLPAPGTLLQVFTSRTLLHANVRKKGILVANVVDFACLKVPL